LQIVNYYSYRVIFYNLSLTAVISGEDFDIFGRNILVAANDVLLMQIAPLLQNFPFRREEKNVEAP
jgi:hypothetical protein